MSGRGASGAKGHKIPVLRKGAAKASTAARASLPPASSGDATSGKSMVAADTMAGAAGAEDTDARPAAAPPAVAGDTVGSKRRKGSRGEGSTSASKHARVEVEIEGSGSDTDDNALESESEVTVDKAVKGADKLDGTAAALDRAGTKLVKAATTPKMVVKKENKNKARSAPDITAAPDAPSAGDDVAEGKKAGTVRAVYWLIVNPAPTDKLTDKFTYDQEATAALATAIALTKTSDLSTAEGKAALSSARGAINRLVRSEPGAKARDRLDAILAHLTGEKGPKELLEAIRDNNLAIIAELDKIVLAVMGADNCRRYDHILNLAGAIRAVCILAVVLKRVVGPTAKVQSDEGAAGGDGSLPGKPGAIMHADVVKLVKSVYGGEVGNTASSVIKVLASTLPALAAPAEFKAQPGRVATPTVTTPKPPAAAGAGRRSAPAVPPAPAAAPAPDVHADIATLKIGIENAEALLRDKDDAGVRKMLSNMRLRLLKLSAMALAGMEDDADD